MTSIRSCSRQFLSLTAVLAISGISALLALSRVQAQGTSPALLVLEKGDNALAIVDPAALKTVTRVPAGLDPHEIAVSADGKRAYISNYGGSDSDLHTISVVDLATHTALPAIDIWPLRSAHGLDFVAGKLYFTVETNKAIGRYDPAAQHVDWILGTGQDRTHMIRVSKNLERIFTSNVNSATISIIEESSPQNAGYGPSTAGRKSWHVINVSVGRGSEGFDVSPDGKELWVANAQDSTVTIIDVANKKAVETLPISVRGANRLKFTLDGKHVFVSGLGGGSNGTPNLVVFDSFSRKEIRRISLGGGAAGILMQPGASRAYVAVSAKNKVAVVDLNTLEVTGEIPTGPGPDGMAWAAKASD